MYSRTLHSKTICQNTSAMLKHNETYAEIRIRLYFVLQKGVQPLEEYANTSHFGELARQDIVVCLRFFFFFLLFNCPLGT